MARTCQTMMRVPLYVGLPWHIFGSATINRPSSRRSAFPFALIASCPILRQSGQDCKRAGLNQFGHWLTSVRDQVLRPACEVREGYLADVNPKVVIKRGEHFAKLHGTLRSFAAQAIRRADDLSVLHAAA